jgi:outer membrane protein
MNRFSFIVRTLALGAALGAIPLLAQEPGPSSTPSQVTLEEAIARARGGNALLKAARADIQVKEGQYKEARSYQLPNVSFTEMGSRTNNPVYVFMGKLTQSSFTMMDFAIPSLNHPDPLTNWQSRVELTVPLFVGGKLVAARKATKLGLDAARDTADFAEASVVKGVTEAFYGSLLAGQAVEVMAEAVKTAQAHQAQVEAMHKEGLILDSDLLRIRVFASDMRQQAAAREADSKVARSYLAYAMGTEEDVEPRGEFSPVSDPLPALPDAQEAALGRRGDLRAMNLQAQQAGEGVKMARADYWPTVGAMAAYEKDSREIGGGPWGDNWMVGVQVRFPLFDGGARAGRVESAKAQQIQAQQALLDLRQKARVDAKAAWLRARAAEERVAVTVDSEAQARENQRIVSLRYNEGMASITDLLDADMALTSASLSRAQAIHDQIVERARLAWAMGKQ